MCGIAGFSLTPHSRLDRTLAAQALLAAIAERGGDAVGYAYPDPDASGRAVVVKQRTPASKLLEQVVVPSGATDLIVHVRAFTKGHPSIDANNHPVRHGPVIGVHNGRILNDDELLAEHDCARAEPRMTVDSEAVFAVAAHSESDAEAFEVLHGTMAAAWLDQRSPEVLHLARGVGRPMWLGECRDGLFFASTEYALEVVERYCSPTLRKRRVQDGTVLAVHHGAVVRRRRFTPPAYSEDDPLPEPRGLREREFCLSRLATIVAAGLG
jgi:glutamine phosphoribosylpyrophosphate amidotransferase